MRDRFMRALVFFDLPMNTSKERKEYRVFRKALITSGFYMLQESVYCKMFLNYSGISVIKKYIYENKPSGGIVQVLIITEKQFSKMEYMVWTSNNIMLDKIERTTVI